MAKYEKLYKRIGFLFYAYSDGYWWFEPVLLFYKLSMTVLILFVSDGDENKILVRAETADGMIGRRIVRMSMPVLTAPPTLSLRAFGNSLACWGPLR